MKLEQCEKGYQAPTEGGGGEGGGEGEAPELMKLSQACHAKTGPGKKWTRGPYFAEKYGPTLPKVDLDGGPFLAREKS